MTSAPSMPCSNSDFENLLTDNAKVRHIVGEFDKLAPDEVMLQEKLGGRKAKLVSMFQGVPNPVQGDSDVIDVTSWIYTLQFPNPDCEDECSQQAVTMDDAVAVFKDCFMGEESEDTWKETRNFTEELEAFKELFQSLDDFEDGKKWCFGGRLRQESEGRTIDSGERAHDFLTLIRNIALVKLTQHLCLNVRQVLSSNGHHIYIIVYGDEEDYLSEAQRVEFNAQLHVYITDWASMEPCDERLRPYRMLNKSPQLQELIEEVDQLLEKLVPGSDRYQFNDSTMYPGIGVSDGHWESYTMFLNEFKAAILDALNTPEPLTEFEKHTFLGKLTYRSIERISKERPKFKLRNLWQRLNFQTAIGAYTDFCRNFDSEGNDTFLRLWRTHSTTNPGQRSLFRNYDKLKLIKSLINRQVVLHSLVKHCLLSQSFPLHNESELNGLPLSASSIPRMHVGEDLLKHVKRRIKSPIATEWRHKHILDASVPVNGVKNYFGEKVALYFGFTGFLTNALIPVAIFGLPLFVVQRTLNYDDKALLVLNAIYCIFIAFWGTIMLEYWRRYEATLAFSWGTTDFFQDEVPRPEFKGRTRRSPINDDLEELFYSPIKRAVSISIGFLVSVVVVLIVIGIVAGLIIMRWKLTEQLMVNGFDGAGPLTSVLNAIQIQIFNFIYEILAFKLTDWENHKTQSSYERSFIVKSYLFQFVNSYNALFYIAFIKSYTEGCIVKDSEGKKVKEVGASCMDELYTQLTSLFLVAYFRNIIELALPFLKNRRRLKAFRNISFTETEADQTCKRIESNLMKSEYVNRTIDGTFADMLEVCISFGYLTIFAVAFPLGGLLAYIGLLLELRVDRYKLLWLMRRPQPEGISEIGIWWYVLQSTLIIAIITNAGLFCFTAHTFQDSLSSSQLFIPFVIIIVVLITVRSWLQALIPDVPSELQIIARRHDTIRTRYLTSWKPAKKDPSKMKAGLNFAIALPSL